MCTVNIVSEGISKIFLFSLVIFRMHSILFANNNRYRVFLHNRCTNSDLSMFKASNQETPQLINEKLKRKSKGEEITRDVGEKVSLQRHGSFPLTFRRIRFHKEAAPNDEFLILPHP